MDGDITRSTDASRTSCLLLVPPGSSRITSGVNLKLAHIIQVVRELSTDPAHLHYADRAMDPHRRVGYEECAIYLFRLQRSTSFPLRIKIGPNFRLFVGRRGPGTWLPLSPTR